MFRSDSQDEVDEVWMPIPTFVKYEVSNFGRVRNSYTEKILKPYKGYGKDGKHYLKVSLYRNGIKYCQFVHRLVVFAFYEVDHRDRDRGHNKLSNLEPVLRRENDMRWRRLENPPF
jgi:hypothetical protein